MRFADPQACPDCRGAIAGQPACPHCGLDLTSIEVRQLWQVLLQACLLYTSPSPRDCRKKKNEQEMTTFAQIYEQNVCKGGSEQAL
ncbi:hypothetical protein AERO_18400, partial [Aeromicrobium fastidiosum]|uniref:hypothetical protein n=1 Tax=Aeromicrobium fastidiosum TaxID=52699 RepID=UPI0020235535